MAAPHPSAYKFIPGSGDRIPRQIVSATAVRNHSAHKAHSVEKFEADLAKILDGHEKLYYRFGVDNALDTHAAREVHPTPQPPPARGGVNFPGEAAPRT